NPVFSAISNFLPGSNPSDKLGFINQGFSSAQGWMNNLVTKTGITPQSISSSLGNFIQIADDNLDFVAAFLDQTTNYYEHTGIQTVARCLIVQAYTSVKQDIQTEVSTSSKHPSSAAQSTTHHYTVGQTVEVWDGDEEDWYQATIQKIKEDQYFVHYIGYGSSDNEWVDEDDVRTFDHDSSDDSGYAVGQKVKAWDEDEEDWYSAVIEKIQGNQYFIHYMDYDSSYDEWVDNDEIC
ncbi:MAG TPA: agenet domain-containing protein, partial [Coleofasciculaceae cyanobacterium]